MKTKKGLLTAVVILFLFCVVAVCVPTALAALVDWADGSVDVQFYVTLAITLSLCFFLFFLLLFIPYRGKKGAKGNLCAVDAVSAWNDLQGRLYLFADRVLFACGKQEELTILLSNIRSYSLKQSVFVKGGKKADRLVLFTHDDQAFVFYADDFRPWCDMFDKVGNAK